MNEQLNPLEDVKEESAETQGEFWALRINAELEAIGELEAVDGELDADGLAIGGEPETDRSRRVRQRTSGGWGGFGGSR